MKNVVQKVSKIKTTNNTQSVARKLLMAKGEWVSRKQLGKIVNSPAARVRDLRKNQFGEFVVECASASTLNKKGGRTDYFYRIRAGALLDFSVGVLEFPSGVGPRL